MRVSAAIVALCLAAPYAASPVTAENNNLDLQKTIQDIAAAVKQTGDKAAEAVSTTTEQVKQAIDKLKQEMEEHQKPIEDVIGQAAHEVAATVKESAAHVGDTIAQAAAAIKEELNDSHDANHASVSDDPCMKACSRILMPVCGSNGRTYSNKCTFEIAQCQAGGEGMLKLEHTGRCTAEEPAKKDPASCLKACTRDYRPVCGSDGKTYSNKCVFEIAQCVADVAGEKTLTLVSMGKCEAEEAHDDCPQFCTMEYSPVCGTNRQTYGNRCALNVAACKNPEQNIEIAHEGECIGEGTAAAANKAEDEHKHKHEHEHEKDDDDEKEEHEHKHKMDQALYISLIVGASVLTALIAVLAARQVRLRRFTSVSTHSVSPADGKLPAYSRLLTEDQVEDDPDELFPPEYSASGYTPVKTSAAP